MIRTSRVQIRRIIAELKKAGVTDPAEITHVMRGRCHSVTQSDIEGALAEAKKTGED